MRLRCVSLALLLASLACTTIQPAEAPVRLWRDPSGCWWMVPKGGGMEPLLEAGVGTAQVCERETTREPGKRVALARSSALAR